MTQTLRSAIDRLHARGISARQFVALWRNETAPLLAELPQNYAAALDELLMRLESGALFGEESCSFSQAALLEQFSLWLERAEARIGAARRRAD